MTMNYQIKKINSAPQKGLLIISLCVGLFISRTTLAQKNLNIPNVSSSNPLSTNSNMPVNPKDVGLDQLLDAQVPLDAQFTDENGKIVKIGDYLGKKPIILNMIFYIGIAIGAGTDVAIEAAKIVLMKSDPLDIVNAILLSKATVRKMKQNLVWASVYNLLAIPVAAGVFYSSFGWSLRPEVSALLMSASSIIVAVNAVMLRRSEKQLLT